MKEIIEPVDISLLIKELTPDRLLRKSNYGGNEIYVTTGHDSPNVMREVGRLREKTFREAGGGTGKEFDVDDYDYGEFPYKQLIVWNSDYKEILGGYRFFNFVEYDSNVLDRIPLATSKLFRFSEKFKNDYLPFLIELGRSFVQTKYQSTQDIKRNIFVLDNLWDGLATLYSNHPKAKYFFGKVTMYPGYNVEARNMLLYVLKKHFFDKEGLLEPIQPLETNTDYDKMKSIFAEKDFKEDYKILSQNIRLLGERIPPLINSYINISPTPRIFGTVINPYFGNVEETAIMVTLKDIYESKTERHFK